MLKKLLKFVFVGSLFFLMGNGCTLQNIRLSEIFTNTPAKHFNVQKSTDTKELRVIERVLEEKNDKERYDVSVKIPQVAYLENKNTSVQDSVNKELEKVVLDAMQQFKKDVVEWNKATQGSEISGKGSGLTIDYKVLSLRPQILSISFEARPYMSGAPHPNFYFFTFNYDLNSEKRISLRDLFNKNVFYLTELSKITNTKLKEQGQDVLLQKRGEEYFEDFTLTQKELIILFDEGVVGPYVIGPIRVAIPWEQLSGILDPQGAGKLLE